MTIPGDPYLAPGVFMTDVSSPERCPEHGRTYNNKGQCQQCMDDWRFFDRLPDNYDECVIPDET